VGAGGGPGKSFVTNTVSSGLAQRKKWVRKTRSFKKNKKRTKAPTACQRGGTTPQKKKKEPNSEKLVRKGGRTSLGSWGVNPPKKERIWRFKLGGGKGGP